MAKNSKKKALIVKIICAILVALMGLSGATVAIAFVINML